MAFWKNRKPSFYEREKERIQEKMALATPGSDEYKKLMDQLNDLRKFTGEEKEMKQFLDKDGKKMVIGKILGFLGIGGLVFGLTKFEKIDGNMFSGSNGEAKKGLLTAAFKLFG